MKLLHKHPVFIKLLFIKTKLIKKKIDRKNKVMNSLVCQILQAAIIVMYGKF